MAAEIVEDVMEKVDTIQLYAQRAEQADTLENLVSLVYDTLFGYQHIISEPDIYHTEDEVLEVKARVNKITKELWWLSNTLPKIKDRYKEQIYQETEEIEELIAQTGKEPQNTIASLKHDQDKIEELIAQTSKETQNTIASLKHDQDKMLALAATLLTRNRRKRRNAKYRRRRGL
ncbi:MAG: hypothetical protein Q4D38_00285 [Planctomycetia bacterium]|nr:hypothetical protein [Planctomycetia bacterium]